jgi:hypothetical protein
LGDDLKLSHYRICVAGIAGQVVDALWRDNIDYAQMIKEYTEA